MTALHCFKAYDIRGALGDELNEDIAYRIGRAYASFLRPGRVVVGQDNRLSSPALKAALCLGLNDAGVDVLDIGLAGTEEVYFATFHLATDGGIMITASHNPLNYNGMKLVREDARPISGDTGLRDIQRMAEQQDFAPVARKKGRCQPVSVLSDFVAHLLGYIDCRRLQPLRLVINSGHGTAGHVIDELERQLQQQGLQPDWIKIQHEPDGTFPQGIPNPLLPECRQQTAEAVLANQADLGIAFDGDFDRCFFFDHQGHFIEGYYMVALLAEAFLAKTPGASIVHDPRLYWNTRHLVAQAGGRSVLSKTGHAFIKERMRQEDAVYGGEMSAHHYFRDFRYCDSGMIPWLLVYELLCIKGCTLQSLVQASQQAFPVSGELNTRLEQPAAAMARVEQHYRSSAVAVDYTDGLSMEFAEWRFNLRLSNTEALLRLNVEARGDHRLMQAKTAELQALIKGELNTP